MTPEAPLPATSVPAGLAEPAFDSNAMRVLKERYFAKKADGTVETPQEFLWRVASSIAEPERPYAAKLGRDPQAVVDGVSHAFYDMMARRDFMPNTPCLVNAGRPLSMLSACFVLPVPDSIEGIFYNLKAMALIQKSGGGCVSADSRVWTTFCGLEPIEVLFNRATIDGRPGVVEGNGTAYDVRDLGIRTVSMDAASGKTALRDVTHVWKFDVPADAQVVVRTREGTEVQTSAWHPFMVLRGREFVEVRADELAAGDVILGPDRPDAFWPWSDYRAVSGLTIDEQIGWLIGFTLGDDSFEYVPALRQERLRWFSGTTDVLDRVRAILSARGIDVEIHTDPRGGTHGVSTLTQGFVASMLAACGFAQGGAKDQRIRIPEHIAKSPLSVVRAFVAGLLDSDGTVADDGSPSYTTASSEMAHDVAALMSLLGYRPTLHREEPHGRGKVPTYTVLLCPLPQVPELAGDVAGFMSSEFRKNRLQSDSRKETALALPFAAWRAELAELGLVQERGVTGAGPLAEELDRWSCNPAGRILRDDLRAVAIALEPLDRSASDLLGAVARRGQEIDTVARAPKALPYYDLTVEGWNTYASGRTGLALIHNTGFAFSELRHQGAEVHSTGKDASGPVSFMKVFNAATDSIKQGGVRRGANMGVLRVDHPDIFHFMSCKKELDAENRALWNRFSDTGRYTDVELAHLKQELLQTQINNFNISVGVTDAFMQAVKDDADFDLRDPRTQTVVKTVRAREIWDAIIEGAWQNGEPGVLFLDHPDVNPLPGLGPIAATNPCVTANTWVFTSQGARRVRDLVGVPFEAVVDGRAYPSSPAGFFYTGNKPVFRVTTSRGFELEATGDHPVLVERDGSRVWKTVAELQLGERLVVHDHENAAWRGRGNFDEGWLLGNLLGDGRLQATGRAHLQFTGHSAVSMSEAAVARIERTVGGRSQTFGTAVVERTSAGGAVASVSSTTLAELARSFGMVHDATRVTDGIESGSSDFICGFLQGWFDADGSVHGDLHDGASVRLVSANEADLLAAQRMLARLGIVSTLYRERHGAADDRQRHHRLVISRRDMVRFAHRVGFSDDAKQSRLLTLLEFRSVDVSDRHRTEVLAIEPAGTESVFDCTIPGVHAFDANGLYVHNCGEQFLHGYDSCNLGSINVGHFYDARTKDVDWERLAQTTAIALRFLDNVIDANIYPIDEIKQMVTNNRRVGLGIMGFADLLIQLQIAYGSPEAVAFAGKLMAFIQQRAQETSEILARERGDFPNKHLSIWADDPRPRRNAALLSIAPTGTISMIAGCSFGCEPYFGMAYTKHVMKDAEGRPQHLYYIVPLFEEISKDEGFFSEELLGKIEENRGSLKGLAGVPQHWQDVFTVAADVTVEQHIDMLAAFQKNTDNAVSKTINAPNDDTRENVSRAIFRAYQAGCKGFTYYRDGSRTEQVVTFSKDGDLGGNRDVAAAATAKAESAVPAAPAVAASTKDELDIEALLAKANALLEVR